jgi:hypothetical protein
MRRYFGLFLLVLAVVQGCHHSKGGGYFQPLSVQTQ